MPQQDQPQVFFHLGLPKTGSTFLQRRIFPYIPGIHFFKKHHFRKYHDLKPVNGEKYFFTFEKDINVKPEMDEIKKKFPENSYVILVFRPHYSWIVSKYKNYIRKFGHLNFDQYFSTTKKDCYLDIGPDFYSSIADYATKLFNGRVLLLNYEELKQSPENFMQKIYNFMGLNEEEVIISRKILKPSFSDNQLVILRKFNRLIQYKKLNSPIRTVNQIYYKIHHFLLHTVAFFAQFVPINTKDFKKEIASGKDKIEAFFKNDWENMMKRFA
ncbi:MAG: sulfotransferase family protein [Marinilabiliaceae bacterium]